jgi:hypothetical protein
MHAGEVEPEPQVLRVLRGCWHTLAALRRGAAPIVLNQWSAAVRVKNGRLTIATLVDSEWRDRFWWRVYETLLAAKTLRFCRRCRAPFLARKRQLYCHPRHAVSGAERNRAYWAKARDRINLSRRLAYDTKMKATIGAKVRARVPRSLV